MLASLLFHYDVFSPTKSIVQVLPVLRGATAVVATRMQLDEPDVKLLLRAATAATSEERALYQIGVTVASIEYPVSYYTEGPTRELVFYAETQQQALYAMRLAGLTSMRNDLIRLYYIVCIL